MEKLEAMKQKLSFKKHLAAGCAVLGLPISAIVSKLVQGISHDALRYANLIKYHDMWQDDIMYVIVGLEQKFVINYGIRLPYADPKTYLSYIEANKAVYGDKFDMVYRTYETAFHSAQENIMNIGNTLGQSQAIGFGAGVLSFLLIAGIPTTRYLMCKKKIKSLEKQNKNNLEIENNLGK